MASVVPSKEPYRPMSPSSEAVIGSRPFSLIAMFGLGGVTGVQAAIEWSLIIGVVFLNAADFRGDTGEEFSVHWQIYLRLLVSAAAGAYGLLQLPKTIRDFITWPGLLVTAYILWYGITIPFSVDVKYSLVAWSSFVGVLLLIPATLRSLGGFQFLLAVASGLMLFVIGSWIAYLFFPEVGVFKEQITRTSVYERMGGLGHPNELGFYSALLVLVLAGLATCKRFSWFLASPGILLGLFTLSSSFSRTAIIACTIGLIFTLQNYWRRPGNYLAILLAGLLTMGVAFALLGAGRLDWIVERVLTSVTKSGSTDELASATGRTEIWAYGIEQILKSPAVGYGYCSARFVMSEHSYHCHNVVLNALMFGGLFSGLIVFAMVIYFLYSILFAANPVIDGLIVFLLIGGLVDGILGAPSPAAPTFLWFTILFWRQLRVSVIERPLKIPSKRFVEFQP